MFATFFCNLTTPHPSVKECAHKFDNSPPIKTEKQEKGCKSVFTEEFLPPMKFHQTILFSIIDCCSQRSAQRDFIMFIFTEPLGNPSRALQISARAFTGGVVLDSRTINIFSSISEIFMLESCQHKMTSCFISFLQHCCKQIGGEANKTKFKFVAQLGCLGCRNNRLGSTENLVSIDDVLINMHYHVFRNSWLSNVKTESKFCFRGCRWCLSKKNAEHMLLII